MGHKVSVIHGVKTQDYYRPGNAINEIWLGHLELISRLPFGDSDLGQAGWPAGGWPKIPWHNFIIPLRRRAKRGVGDQGGNSDQLRIQTQLPLSVRDENWILCILFQLDSLMPFFVLFTLAVVSYSFPVVLRRKTPPYDCIRGNEKSGQRRKGYELRAWLAAFFLTMGLVLAVLDIQALIDVQELGIVSNSVTVSLLVAWLATNIVGLWHSARAVYSFWVDLRETPHQHENSRLFDHDEEVGASSALVEENLPLIVSSWLERQRRA